MTTVSTRRARPEDAPAIAALALRSYLPYVARTGGRRPAPMNADHAASVAHDLVWVAELAGDLVGFVVLVDEPPSVLLESVAVDPDHQGRGVGRLLIALAEEHATTLGRTQVRLYTHATMTENRRLYPRLGYAEVDRRTEDGFDRVFFEKHLDGAPG